MNFSAHDTYASNGAMIDRGAAFAASHLNEASGAANVGTPHGGFGG
jgi:hypothetical protein